MRSLKRAYDGICGFESLYLSHKRARRGKREKTEVVLFEMELNAQLDTLRRRLQDESYRPGAYRVFEIREPKVRRVESRRIATVWFSTRSATTRWPPTSTRC